jgi:hypothetical protein
MTNLKTLMGDIGELWNRLIGLVTELKNLLLQAWKLVLQIKDIALQLLILVKTLVMSVVNKAKSFVPSKKK